MPEIFNSIGHWLREKTTSPLYGTFIFSVILWNWKFFYVLFWQDQNSLSIPKVEYVQQNIINTQGYVLHFLYFLVLPAVSTYIIVWWMPMLSTLAHKISTDFYFKRKMIFDETRISYEEARKKDLNKLVVIKQEQARSERGIQESMTEEERWEIEYMEFRETPVVYKFQKIIDAVYTSNGYMQNPKEDSDIIAAVDSRGLVSFSDEYNTRFAFTAKGKFFVKKYLSSA